MNKKGTILVVTLWILAILSLLAVGVGFRMGLDIKLTGFNVSELKALYLIKAGINKAIARKWVERLEGKSVGIDALSQSWSNDKESFYDIKLGEGNVSLSYQSKELDRAEEEYLLYGMEDESSRININSDKLIEPLKILLMEKGLDLNEATEIVSAIKDWRDRDDIYSLGGAEESFYQDLDMPYNASNSDFKAVEELLLIKGITETLFYGEDINKNGRIDPEEEGIRGFVTVFGEGKININTAPEPVLKAVFGVGFSDLASKIVDYRKGFDGKIGTSDDRWFASGSFIIKKEKLGLAEIKNLNDVSWSGNIFGVSKRDWERIKELVKEGIIVTTSDIYRINALAKVRKVKKQVTAIIKFNETKPLRLVGLNKSTSMPDVEYLYWHEE